MKTKQKILNYIVTLLFLCSLLFTVPVNAETRSFRDVSNSDWFAPYVYTLLEEGAVSGMTATTFAPTQSLTRAQLVTMLAYREPEEVLENARDNDLLMTFLRNNGMRPMSTGLRNRDLFPVTPTGRLSRISR